MPPRAHALLGASGAHRWMACPASARLEETLPESTSTAAEEGTLAHAIVETKLTRFLSGEKTGMATEEQQADPLYQRIMEDHTDEYIDYVIDLYGKVRAECPDAELMSEMRVNYSRWVPEGFGTTDTVIIADGTAHVIDFKYGKGVPVSAIGNPQLRLYALGALEAFGILYDIRDVTVHIVQPRTMEGGSSETLHVNELLRWADEVVAPAAQAAYAGGGEAVPGEHCRFCRAGKNGLCRKRRDVLMERVNQVEQRDPQLLTDEEIADLLPILDDIAKWCKSVQDYALNAATNNHVTFHGYKLVHGRSNRRITDATAAATLLLEAGYEAETIMTDPQLRGITELEAKIGKKALAETLGDLLEKPEGKPTLVPASDPREAIANDMFKDEE